MNTTFARADEMQERVAPSRPSRLGTRRRKPRQAVSDVPKAGASRPGEDRAPSLDTEKQLATTVREMLISEASEKDIHDTHVALQRQLNNTVHKIWQDYAAAGDHEQAVKWEKLWLRIHNCQSEWIAYRASCCHGFTQPIAVPIGCNFRLCPLCCYQRSQKARKKIRVMFDRLDNPAMLTLTVPNKGTIRKHDFTLFRQRVRSLIKQHSHWIKGGVYSLETTYNRKSKTWHIHAHVLMDCSTPLPTKADRVTLAGERVYAFTAIKLRLEFEWLRLWGSQWGKKPRKDAQQLAEGDTFTFEKWVRIGRQMRVKAYRNGSWKPIEGVSQADMERRTLWNTENRRVVDVRPVTDRDGAAAEVLKYITKVAAFSDIPEAVEPFVNAVTGARLIQTFGTWYGVNLDKAIADDPFDAFQALNCTCGLNIWKRMQGVFRRGDVAMDEAGRWRLKAPLDHTCRGTVARPTIRALDAPIEDSPDGESDYTRR